MLQLYPSNRTEHLASVISEIMKARPLSEVFASEVILIQSHGMGTWLQQQISTHLGIAAMIDCRMPASFIWQLAQDMMPDERLIPGFEKKNLRWQIFERLPEKLADSRYQSLKVYLETVSSSEPLLFQVSDAIADVYDGYQNYRPDWIAAWENKERAVPEGQVSVEKPVAELEAWQADLWRSVYPGQALETRKHRALLLEKLSVQLDNLNTEQQAQLPERLFIFGLSALPPQWLPIVLKLSRYCDVHFLVQNPCQYYWGDILCESQRLRLEQALVAKGVSTETAAHSFLEGNPLLASWGQQGRDYLSILLQHDEIKEVPVDLYDASDSQNTVLANLQDDILNLQAIERPVQKDDNSIRFARCHSALREVEALHDYVFGVMDQFPDLTPGDIIVMMPEVQNFAALIEAVFSRPAYDGHGQAHYLPYGISDQLLAEDQPMVEILQGVLNVSGQRMTATEVLDWLDVAAIRSKFDIAEQDLPQIHHWIEALSIRWGLSAAHRDQRLAETNSSLERKAGQGNTWLSALRRLVAGYLYGDDDLLQDGGGYVLPYPQHSTETQLLAGKLMRFVDVLEQTLREFQGQRSVDNWLKQIAQSWSRWFDQAQLSAEIIQLMTQSLGAVGEQAQYAGFEQRVSFKVVADALSAHFQQERVSQRFLTGRINFCTLMPMRSIPFKVVCMIGMNEGQYPRPEYKTGFDLMEWTPRRLGDRSRRDDDRYLFIEALCSARSHLYISYCGNDAKDNSKRYPSLLVSELRDYCGRYFYLPHPEPQTLDPSQCAEALLNHWTFDHRLQPFHTEYYQQPSPTTALPQSHSTEWLPLFDKCTTPEGKADARQKAGQATDQVMRKTPTELDLEQLVRFADHPLKYYYQHTLGLNYSGMASELDDSEPFGLSFLDEYQLKAELSRAWYDSRISTDQLFERWQAGDRLPRSPVDRFCFDSVVESMNTLRAGLANYGDFFLKKITTDLNSVRVVGDILLSNRGQIELAVSAHIANRFFGFWVRHVFWNLYRAQNSSLVESTSGNSTLLSLNNECCLPELDGAQAKLYAFEIIECFQNAETMQPLLPRSTYAMLFESSSKVSSAFNGVNIGNAVISGERDDPYWRRACQLGALSGVCQADELPDLEDTIFYRQVAEHLPEIEVRKL